jgi:dienelactone hydrolase
VKLSILTSAALITAPLLAGAGVAQLSPQANADLAKEVAAQRAAYAQMPDTPGTGPYPALKEVTPSLADHVIYRPANLASLGKRKLGVLIWGNGGCSDDGASARLHLAEIASHGYLAIAPGAIRSGPGAPPPQPAQGFDASGKLPPVKTTAADLIRSIDWAYAENARAGSPFYHRLDLNRLAVAGHSCGGLQALQVAADPRVHAVVIHNSGVFADGSNPIRGMEVDKSILKKLHTPVLYILGGPKDVAYPNGMDDFAKIDTVPVMVANLAVGHGGTFTKPNGGLVAQVAIKWLDWQLSGDKAAAKTFVGKDCGLCTDPAWTVDRKRIE